MTLGEVRRLERGTGLLLSSDRKRARLGISKKRSSRKVIHVFASQPAGGFLSSPKVSAQGACCILQTNYNKDGTRLTMRGEGFDECGPWENLAGSQGAPRQPSRSSIH